MSDTNISIKFHIPALLLVISVLMYSLISCVPSSPPLASSGSLISVKSSDAELSFTSNAQTVAEPSEIESHGAGYSAPMSISAASVFQESGSLFGSSKTSGLPDSEDPSSISSASDPSVSHVLTLPSPTTEPDLKSNNVYEAYLMTFFVQTGTWIEQYPIHLAYSYDGFRWTTLAGDTGISTFKSRDPHLFRRDNNTFLIMTSGGYGSINLFESDDLCTDISVKQARIDPRKISDTWVGEIFKDPADGKYMIHYTIKIPYRREHVLYYVKTTDFLTFTEPELMLSEDGVDIIDSSVFYDGKYYYLLFKNDDTDDTHISRSDSATGPYSYSESKILLNARDDEPTEGAFIVPENNGNRYLLYYDKFMDNGHWGLKTISQLAGDLTDVSAWRNRLENWFYTLPQTPQGGPRHGNIIPITSAELDKLIEKWG